MLSSWTVTGEVVLHRKRCKGEMLSSWTVTGEVVLHCALMGGEDYFPQRLRAFESKS